MQITDILNYVENNTNSALFFTPNIYPDGKSYFFKEPKITLKGKDESEIEEVLQKADHLMKNKDLIGFAVVPYEIGYFFQPKKISESYNNESELLFLFYNKKNIQIIDANSMKFEGVEDYIETAKKPYQINLEITRDEYIDKINKIKKYIRKGDTYQINFTTKVKFNFEEDLISLFLQGIFNQSARYSALINTSENYILSFSPELFF